MNARVKPTAAKALSPALQRVFSEGLPATLDGAVEVSEALRALVANILDQRGRIRERSQELFREWCALPNVTLDQACWLLLECNPWSPPEWLDGLEAEGEHARIRNRLECEVGRSLTPLKPYLPGVPLRFFLEDVARVAQAVEVQSAAAAVLTEINSEVWSGRQPSGTTLQRRRVDERMSFHRAFVQRLASLTPPRAQPLAAGVGPSARARARRKYSGPPVNCEVIGMTQAQYCTAYREAMTAKKADGKQWWEADDKLIDDCRALNIVFAAHRPKGSKDKIPRHLAGH